MRGLSLLQQHVNQPALVEAQARGGLCLADVLFLAISVRPIISAFTGPIFTKFAGLAEL